MKLLKKNQVIIYVIAIMLMTAGYLNYTTSSTKDAVETSMQIEAKDDSKIADLGDATLVSSNDVVSENSIEGSKDSEKQNSTNTANEAKNDQTTEKIEENNTVQTSSNGGADDYFTKSKLERDTMYSQMIETYEKVLNSNNSLETQKQSATQEITKINETKNSIIFVNGESISIIIGTKEIKQEEVAQIQNIISREMNAKIENIHIATK